MQIEAGKFYKTRNGERVGPMRPASSVWNRGYAFETVLDGSVEAWTASGSYSLHGRELYLDLIAECTDSHNPYAPGSTAFTLWAGNAERRAGVDLIRKEAEERVAGIMVGIERADAEIAALAAAGLAVRS